MDSADGGYYAIKGFEFQIDKTILEILNTDEDVSLENIQDISTDNIVIQVKYKETQKYSDNQIREPVLQLVEEFKNDPSKKYKLFCYFLDKPECEEEVDIAKLNSILTPSTGKSEKAKKLNNRIEAINFLKDDFVKNFIIAYSKDYQEQFVTIIKKLQNDFLSNSSYDDAIFYYSNAAYFLRKIVIDNVDSTKRVCSKNKLINYLKDGKKSIFDSSFREYKGEENYFKLVKKKHFTFSTIDDFERFFIIEVKNSNNVSDIKEVVSKIKNKFYKEYKGIVKSGAPYIYFNNISDELLLTLKTELLSEGWSFRDGHDFYNAEFCIKNLRVHSTKENIIHVKFLNKLQNLESLLAENLGKIKHIYQFFITNPVEVIHDIKHIKIQTRCLSEISKFF